MIEFVCNLSLIGYSVELISKRGVKLAGPWRAHGPSVIGAWVFLIAQNAQN